MDERAETSWAIRILPNWRWPPTREKGGKGTAKGSSRFPAPREESAGRPSVWVAGGDGRFDADRPERSTRFVLSGFGERTTLAGGEARRWAQFSFTR